MSINNIYLSPEQLAALYPDSLVMDKEQETQPAPAYPFLGKNLRRICFIVFYPETVFLPDDQLSFLTRILSACHCSLADISVLNAAHTPVDIQKLIIQLNPEMLFLCGVSPASLNLPKPLEPFSISRFQGISTLLIPSLTLLSQKETADLIPVKKQLWSSLKTLFNL